MIVFASRTGLNSAVHATLLGEHHSLLSRTAGTWTWSQLPSTWSLG